METAKLKKFAQFARRSLMEQVSAKLKLVLAGDSAARRERPKAVKELDEAIQKTSKAQVIERVAYIWFNRFCALRFMDVNRYTRIGVVSPAEGQFQPEILAEAKMGHIDEEMVPEKIRQQIFALLDGKAPSRDPQGEAYRLLVVAACNFWNKAMPFLFQRIDDYTELLMPDNLLSGNSILAYTREAMTPDACEDVEVIGWLYQFYISEKKDEVFAGLKKGKKITPENIPAATQLFTPHWIVRYLVENSLGRLWMLNRPGSKLVEQMDYYIKPEEDLTTKNTQDINHEKHEPHENKNQEDFRDFRAFRGSKEDFLAVNTTEGKITTKNTQDINHEKHEPHENKNQETFRDFRAFRGSKEDFLAVNATGGDLTTKDTNGTKEEKKENNELVGNAENEAFRDFRAFRGSEKDFLVVNSPEEIKICDPACGSGHMLTYAFDLLYAIYEEEGVDPAEIPKKILTNNLYGIEIDERAGELAAFALTMKAASKYKGAKQRRSFNKGVRPNICVLENVDLTTKDTKSTKSTKNSLFLATEHTDDMEWKIIVDDLCKTGVDRNDLLHDLGLFAEADNFGSLLRPRLTSEQAQKALEALTAFDLSVKAPTFGHRELVDKCKQALRQAEYLSPKYHVVIANPPYLGSKGMHGRLVAWLKDNYADVKSDLFSAFIVRNTELTLPKGQLGFMSPFVWMFISSYEKLRSFLINQKTITSLVQLEYSGFDGATVPICTFTVENDHRLDFKGGYVKLSDFRGPENQGPRTLEAINNPDCGWFYRASAANFKKIPNSPIAYWVPNFDAFNFPNVAEEWVSGGRIKTHDGQKYIRFIWEVTRKSDRWKRLIKGGDFRKHYGNEDFLVDWSGDAVAFYEEHGGLYPEKYRSKEGICWSKITSALQSFRIKRSETEYDSASPTIFNAWFKCDKYLLSLLNSRVSQFLLKAINPTLNTQVVDVMALPVCSVDSDKRDSIEIAEDKLIDASSADWNSYETSWDFNSLSLLDLDNRQPTLKATYQKLRAHWREMTLEMQRLEEENNRIFIEAYGLQDELTPEVPLNEITLTCNPYYRYGKEANHEKHETHEKEKKHHSGEADKESFRDFRAFRGSNEFPVDDELEARLLADTMRELVSYAVGCMFGRYALDKPGLILANQGETIEDYYEKIFNHERHETHEKEKNDYLGEAGKESFRDFRAFRGSCFFPADEDNVIPMLDGDWFADDIAERFRKFLRVAFGEEHYEANLKFVEKALGKNGKARDIRDYFLKDFYTDHVKRYKKRPIYWLFSSPKGSFNALIYLHRYRPDTVSVVLNDYLREFKTKLTAHRNHLEAVNISASAQPAEKTAAIKEIEKLKKTLAELDEWEREVLYPLAARRIEIDLDDGVKVNYLKFGGALKKVPGLSE